MTYVKMGARPLDYEPCSYGESRLLFRGPARDLTGEYVAFLGGTETYGKFLPRPFPHLVEEKLGVTCVNFGQVNAGVDAYLGDSAVIEAASGAALTVVQVMGANNLSNRFYTVHPRRNDRFLRASQLMQSVFREVDFTEFHFTRHMLGALAQRAPKRFATVIAEIQSAWLARMALLLGRIGSDTVLLWFGDHPPPTQCPMSAAQTDPFAVERSMIEKLRPHVATVIELTAHPAALASETAEMVFTALEAPAAHAMLGPAAHEAVALRLADALRGRLGRRSH
ncbi:DUF6473 family protein [Aquicoccus sp. G2-2]|uniref:DUF6473 family protein n=1 Tax=Aquicoccus sp. G2-2 TaxID=3092120 RepID=UPI002ADF573E|nr:DUF6473 family protein [Aquicoccus sp. G2-2]MEA1112344.1 DUF6473 family protein [Aquicoccus sp. G2-2]